MNKGVARKSFVLGIIMLFVGTSVLPNIGTIAFGEHTITLECISFDCGWIVFDGTQYPSYEGGITIGVDTGTYTIFGLPLEYSNINYDFGYWTSTGGLTVADPYSQSTTVSVSGSGTLTARFIVGPTAEFSPTYIDFGTHFPGWTGSETVEIWNCGTGTLTYTISESVPWISVYPTSGSSTGEHNIHTINIINTDGMSGYYEGDVFAYFFGHNSGMLFTITIQGLNQPPYFTDISPVGTNVDINADLSWIVVDDDPGDIVTYSVWFGTNSNPPLVMSNSLSTTYDPGIMSYNTQYYFLIYALDEHGGEAVMQGDFTTENSGNQPPIAEAGGPYIGSLYEQVNFDASGSHDPEGGALQYRWDWENDGTYDTPWLSSPYLGYIFEENEEKHGTLKLQVMDNNGATNTDTASIDISKNLAITAVYLAKQVFGTPYIWGKKGYYYSSPYYYFNNPGEIQIRGLDCSGLIFWVYNRANFGGDALTYQQWENRPLYYYYADGQYWASTRITKNQLQPGDFLYFDEYPIGDGKMDHTALYVGSFSYNGNTYNVIHASGFAGKVVPAIYDVSTETLTTSKPSSPPQILSVDGYGRLKMQPKKTNIIGKCPIDLIVTDPNGLVLSKTSGEVPGMYYMEYDITGDGDIDDIVSIPEIIPGDYFVNVIAEPGADPTDTYSLEIYSEETNLILAENVQISNIPNYPYIARVTETEIYQIIPVIIDINPNTLNRNSNGKWITCYIELPQGFNVSNITISSILLNGIISAQSQPTNIGDYDNDGIPDLMVKFSRSAVAQILQPGDNVEIKVSGTLVSGMEFEGVDYITVI